MNHLLDKIIRLLNLHIQIKSLKSYIVKALFIEFKKNKKKE